MDGESSRERDWLELLQEFRRLGGTADNLRLGNGPLGRGLFPIDPSLPVALRVPENLLLPIEQARFQDGTFVVGPDAGVGPSERAWLEHYENAFSWGAGGRRDTELFLEDLLGLPLHIRNKLAHVFGTGFCLSDLTPELVQQRFIRSRMITHNGRHVVMPLVELVNHGDAPTYDFERGVGVKGEFSGEVLVRYSDDDSLAFFQNWGFVCARPVAMSLPVQIPAEFGRLNIGRDMGSGEIIEIAARQPFEIRLPTVSQAAGTTSLSFLTLGTRGYPRVPRGIYHRVFRQAGLPVKDELFEHIQFINRTLFLELMGLLEDVEAPMARSLRTLCRLQLETLCHCIGAREI